MFLCECFEEVEYCASERIDKSIVERGLKTGLLDLDSKDTGLIIPRTLVLFFGRAEPAMCKYCRDAMNIGGKR